MQAWADGRAGRLRTEDRTGAMAEGAPHGRTDCSRERHTGNLSVLQNENAQSLSENDISATLILLHCPPLGGALPNDAAQHARTQIDRLRSEQACALRMTVRQGANELRVQTYGVGSLIVLLYYYYHY